MIEQRVILDTSLLVSLLSKSDHNHAWAVRQWAQVHPPALTIRPVG